MKVLVNVVALLLAGDALLAGTASAQQPSNPPPRYDQRTIVVDIEDLQAARPEDARTLLQRLRIATRNACERLNANAGVQQNRDRARCQRDSYTRTLAALNAQLNLDMEAIAATPRSEDDMVAGVEGR